MKFVFFVHYFPPLNSTGTRRVASFAKYLARNGHEIVVVSTAKTSRDGAITEPVPSWVRLYEIDHRGRVVHSEPASSAATPPTRIHWSRRIKQALMGIIGQLPDPRILFPLGIISKNLDPKVCSELESADIFVSSFPPWPMHLAAMFAKRRFGKPWIADYRDQFADNHIMSGIWPFTAVEHWLDRKMLAAADVVTTVSPPMRKYYAAFHPNVVSIENGYDDEMIDAARMTLVPEPRKYLVVRYLGSVVKGALPVNFVKAVAKLAALAHTCDHLRIEVRGDTHLLESYVCRTAPHLIGEWFHFLPKVSAAEAIQQMLAADALLFASTSDMSSLSAEGVLTTKLFEYLASGRPIIAETSNLTLAAHYIRESSGQHVISMNADEIAAALQCIKSGTPDIPPNAFVKGLTRVRKAAEFEAAADQGVGSNSIDHDRLSPAAPAVATIESAQRSAAANVTV